jgi:hypothetical protein
MSGWRIESRQLPVFDEAGVRPSEEEVRLNVGHNYLALVGPDGVAVDQIHGGPRGREGHLRLEVFADSEREEKSTMAKEVRRASDDDPSRNVEAFGTYKEADDRWKEYKASANQLNDMKIDYGVWVQNSNSAWATILRMQGHDPKEFRPESDRWTPGVGDDLRGYVPPEKPDWQLGAARGAVHVDTYVASRHGHRVDVDEHWRSAPGRG